MKKYTIYILSWALILFGLYISSLRNYLLFHSIAEIFSIVIAFMIFTIAWNSRRLASNNYFLFVGIAFFFVGLTDLLHTLAYSGMAIFEEKGTDLPTQLWVVARYTQSISFVIAPLFFRRNIKASVIFFSYTLVISLLLISIFYWSVFPTCFIESRGLTPFKKISEYIISLILLSSILLLLRYRDEFDRHVFIWVICSVSLTIASEIVFSSYANAYSHSNLIGHYLKIVAFWFLYKAFIETNFIKPYNLIFRDLKLSEERYHTLFNNMINGFARHRVLFDKEGKPVDYIFLEVNTAFERLTGLNKDNLIGKRVTEVIPGIERDSTDWIGIYGRVAMTGEPVRLENYSELSERWYAILAYSTEKGYFASVFEDITERVLAEKAVKESKEMLEILVQERTSELSRTNELLDNIIGNIPAIVCLYDSAGRIEFTNRAFKDLTGWNRDDIGSVAIMRARDSENETYREMWQYMKEPHQGWRDFLIQTRDGGILETTWANVLLSDRSVLTIGIDITERKKAEENLVRYMEKLERSNRDLEEFAFIASHDLREPLRKVQTFGDMLAAKSHSSLDKTSKDYLKRMQKATARMQNLLNSLLAYSRVTTQAEPMKETDLRISVETALSNLEIMVNEKNARLEVGELPTVMADRVQMVQLFQNLIVNALKFHRENNPPRIKIYAQQFAGSGRKNSRSWHIYIEDNGTGFEDKYLEQIFIPFQRLHGRGVYEGVGMGLAICKKIVEHHNGNITAKSTLGIGTTFIITLPERQIDT